VRSSLLPQLNRSGLGREGGACYSRLGSTTLAFTLIEMLTVITIMAIVAALVVTMGGAAKQKTRITQVKGDQSKLLTMINNYHEKLGYYPPDNGLLVSAPGPQVFGGAYDGLAATNPLLYELIGGTNNALGTSNLFVFNSTNASSLLSPSDFSTVFNRGGVGNSDPTEPHDFFLPGPSPKEYTNYALASAGGPPICGLVVPVELTNVLKPNFWHYDSSSTNRHNMTSFDLWAEFSVGGKLYTNGNW